MVRDGPADLLTMRALFYLKTHDLKPDISEVTPAMAASQAFCAKQPFARSKKASFLSNAESGPAAMRSQKT